MSGSPGSGGGATDRRATRTAAAPGRPGRPGRSRLRAAAGRVTVLLGPNGAGKSTLLRSIAGLQHPLAGRSPLGGRTAGRAGPARPGRAAGGGAHRTVRSGLLRGGDVVALGRFPHRTRAGIAHRQDRQAVADAFAAVHAEDLADVLLARMSDGQRQRIMIARALAQAPAAAAARRAVGVPGRPGPDRAAGGAAPDRRANGSIPVVASTHDVEAAVQLGQDGWLIGPGRR